ncbi:MAG: single-stranded DNA-binding protein [Leptospirales bacterium]|nr:single-stranded DNA-binding protein [Leptospirales bacterium]
MKNYVTATVEGFVTRDPVLRTTKTGKNVCSFSLAVNHFSKEAAEPGVSYIDVETWEKLAESCFQKIAKGKRVIVIGGLRQDRWVGSDGKNQAKIKIVGNEVRFIEQPSETSLKEAV